MRLTSFIYLYLFTIATEKEMLSQSGEKQKEIETLQEIITSLTLRLRESEKQNEELNQKLKGDWYYNRYQYY